MSSFQQARSGIRMEEPCRILTRFALDLVSNLFQSGPLASCNDSAECDTFCFDPALAAMSRQFERCKVVSSAAVSSDAASMSHQSSQHAAQPLAQTPLIGRHLHSSTTKSSVSSKPEAGKGKKKGSKEEEKKRPPTP
jgi:hypothetical protein